jgi:hypothetical protein
MPKLKRENQRELPAANSTACGQEEPPAANARVATDIRETGLCPGVLLFRSGDNFRRSRLELIRQRVALRGDR